MKKPDDRKDVDILLTAGSSRRKMAWRKLRGGKPVKGLTRDQVSYYLESFMKKHYQKVRREGALTSDKVERYLDYLAKLASSSLSKAPMDQDRVAAYSERIQPVVDDVATKSAITDADVAKHSKEITIQAQQHIKQILQQATGKTGVGVEEETKGEYTSGQPESTKETIDKGNQKSPVDTIDILTQELVPLGFEEGAPKVSLETFLSFPLAKKAVEPAVERTFDMHVRYLDMAVKKSCLEATVLNEIKPLLKKNPISRYSKYFDIFPDDEYDDAQLMIIYSQWRNKTLKRLLIDKQGESKMPDSGNDD